MVGLSGVVVIVDVVGYCRFGRVGTAMVMGGGGIHGAACYMVLVA